VTGGCGFIGAHLCAHLVQRGEDIVVVDDLSVGSPGNLEALDVAAVDVQTVDIRDVESLTRLLRKSRPEKVIHLAAVHFIPLHVHPYYRERYALQPRDYPNAWGAYERIVSLPIYAKMTDDDVRHVIDAVREIAREAAR